MKDRLIRVYAAFIELTDAFIDLFAEPLKVLLPWPIAFWRPDNNAGWLWTEKPIGYWLAHLIGVPVLLLALWLLGTLAGLGFSVIMSMLGAEVQF